MREPSHGRVGTKGSLGPMDLADRASVWWRPSPTAIPTDCPLRVSPPILERKKKSIRSVWTTTRTAPRTMTQRAVEPRGQREVLRM